MKKAKLLTAFAAASLGMLTITGSSALAVELLQSGNLDESVGPRDWSLTTSITGMPGQDNPGLFEHNDGSNNPPTEGLGLVFKPQSGNQGEFAGMNLKSNFVFEQVRSNFPIANLPFTLKGDTYWGGNFPLESGEVPEGYSGGVTLLHSQSPSDPTPEDGTDPASIPSTTQTMVEVAFLNNSDVVVGTPSTLDLRTVQMNDAMWRTFSLPTPNAPATATKVRVRVTGTDLVDNFGFQDFLLDNLSLKRTAVEPPAQPERLLNGNLNTPGEPTGWVVTEGPQGTATPGGPLVTADTASFINFANHTPGGAQGLWVRPFVNTTGFDPDIPSVFAKMHQVVPAVAGEDYTFSAWTVWETAYCGGLPGCGGQTLLKMEFLDGSNNPVAGGSFTLDLYAAGMRNDEDGGNIEPEDWRQFSLPGTAPAGTQSVKVSLEALNMSNSLFPDPQSAFFDDFSLMSSAAPGLDGDYNEDGTVDAADYVAWRKNPGAFGGDPAGYNTFRENFGEPSPGSGSAAGVPEPAAACLMLLGFIGVLCGQRRHA